MKHVLKVWLYGGLANDYLQPLSRVTLCLHSWCESKTTNQTKEPYVTGLSDPSEKQDVRKKMLVAMGVTDTKGKIDLHLNDRYPGGAFDVGIQIRRLYQEKNHYVHLATLTPSWHKHGDELISAWNHCLLPRSSNQFGICSSTAGYQSEPSPSRTRKEIRKSVPTPGVE